MIPRTITSHFRKLKSGRRSVIRVALKLAGIMIAVPALCAGVFVAGVVPLYLMLPASNKVEAPVRTAAASSSTSGASSNGRLSVPEQTKAISSTSGPPKPYTPPVRIVDPAEAPPADDLLDDAPPAAKVAIPTPKPANVAPPQAKKPAPVAAAKPPEKKAPVLAKRQKAKPNEEAQRENTRPSVMERALGRGSVVIRRTVTMRSDPWGDGIATVKAGTPVNVIFCDGWCEVEAFGVQGWVHSSYLAGLQGR